MIRLATIGTSAICDSFVRSALLTKEFVLYSVYSRKQETGLNFANKYDCKKVYTSLLEMAADPLVDAVYIASPNSLHFEQSRIFLEAGKHVICEKPITTKAEEYSRLKDLADQKGVIYMEAIMSRLAPHHKDVHNAVAQIGKIKNARFIFYKRSTRLEALLRGEDVNIFNMELHTGTLMDIGVYCVWAAIDFLGMPKGISATAEFYKTGADSSGVALFDYGDFTAELLYSKFEESPLFSEITGENGKVIIKGCSQYTDVYLNNNLVVGFVDRLEVMAGEAKRFADYILRYDDAAGDYDLLSKQCLQVHTCMDAIKKSAGIVYGKPEN